MRLMPCTLAALALAVCPTCLAQRVIATVPAEASPAAIGVDVVTNRVFVANRDSASVTVIDGATQKTVEWSGRIARVTRVDVGEQPAALAVNPFSQRVFVANEGAGSVSVINAESLTAVHVPVGSSPRAVAVNPISNRAYVANYGSHDITVIDGHSLATTTLPVGLNPVAVAVNPETNQIYVANEGGDSVTVIDGATLATTTIETGQNPRQLALDPRGNRVYVLNGDGDWVTTINTITVIDGATHSTSILPGAMRPAALTVDTFRNRLLLVTRNEHVSPNSPGGLHVIDPTTGGRSVVGVGVAAQDVAISQSAGLIFVANATLDSASGSLTVIDADTLAATNLPIGERPGTMALNPVTQRLYVASASTSKVVVLDATALSLRQAPTGPNPVAVGIDVTTGRGYVANADGASVSVIDDSLELEMLVPVSAGPAAIAVNPLTGRVYAPDEHAWAVTMIERGNGRVSDIAAGMSPLDAVVNPVTNTVYVSNFGSNNVTIIDGRTQSSVTIAAGDGPHAMAANPATNKVYVANRLSDDLTVISDRGARTLAVPVGAHPVAVAVDTGLNRVYVANAGSNSVTVIDGETDSVLRTFEVGQTPMALAVDPRTHRVFVANHDSSNVSVIDWALNPALLDPAGVVTVPVAAGPTQVAFDPLFDVAYVSCGAGRAIALIDSGTLSASLVGNGASPGALAVDPLSGRLLATNPQASTVTVASRHRPDRPTPLALAIAPLPGHFTPAASPSVTFLSSGSIHPHKVYYQVNSTQGRWLEATGIAPHFTATLQGLMPGTHVLYAFASSGEDATLASASRNGYVSPISAYAFTFGEQAPAEATASLINGSGRARIEASQRLVGGFVIGGTSPKAVLVRALGPSLLDRGMPEAVSSPYLEVHSGGQLIARNAGWMDNPREMVLAIESSGLQPDSSAESALMLTLPPGAYTAIVGGGQPDSGYAMVDVFEQDSPDVPMLNVSMLGEAGLDDASLIAGFILGGSVPRTVLITARGPTLAEFGVVGPMANPRLALFSGQTKIHENNDWRSQAAAAGGATAVARIQAMGAFPNGLAPAHADEAALLVTLPPGAYTAVVSGENNSTGVAIVEVFAK